MNTIELTAKEYLHQAYRIDQRINSKLEQVLSLRNLAEKASTTLSNTPSGGTRNVHRMEDIVAKMMDMEAEIKADITALVDLKRDIVFSIKRVGNKEYQTLLELRYLSYWTWEEISVELHYDIRHVHRLHSRALYEIDALRRSCHGMS